MVLVFILWAVALTMMMLAMSAMFLLVAARIVRDRADVRRAGLTRDLQSALLQVVAGDTLSAPLVAKLHAHPAIVATLLLEIGGVIRGGDRDRLLQALEVNGVFAIIRDAATSGPDAYRLSCVEAVALFPSDEASLLLRGLWRDPDLAIRFAAVGGLVARGDAVSVPATISNLLSQGGAPSGRALEVIGRLAGQNPQAALQAASHPHLSTTAIAAILHAVGASGDYGLIDDLAIWTSDPDGSVRAAAIDALGLMRHPGAKPMISAALDDPVWQVREAAIRATGLGGFETEVEMLATRLADPLWTLRFAAARALAQMPGTGLVRIREAAGQASDPRMRDLARATLAELELS